MLVRTDKLCDINLHERYARLLESQSLIDFDVQIDFVSCVHDEIVTASTHRILLTQSEIKFTILEEKLNSPLSRNEIIAMPINISSYYGEFTYYSVSDGNHSFVAYLLEGCRQVNLKLIDPISYMSYCGDDELNRVKKYLCLNRGALPRIVEDFSVSDLSLIP